jgi:hypothetical protein
MAKNQYRGYRDPAVFFGANPEGAWITSGLPVIRPESFLLHTLS